MSLAYLRDQSHGELAEQLQLPLGTVKTGYGAGWRRRQCMARYARAHTLRTSPNNLNGLQRLAASYALGNTVRRGRLRFETLCLRTCRCARRHRCGKRIETVWLE